MSGDAFFGILFGILAVNALLATIPANIASKKGHSYGGYWAFGFFLSFVIALVVSLVIEDKNNPRVRYVEPQGPVVVGGLSQTLKCPACAEWIKSEAKICKHCQHDVSSAFAETLRAESGALEVARKEAQLAQEARAKEVQEAATAANAARLARQREKDEKSSNRKKFLKSPKGVAVMVGILVVVGFVSVGAAWGINTARNASVQPQVDAYKDWSISAGDCATPPGVTIKSSSNQVEVTFAGRVKQVQGAPLESFLHDYEKLSLDCLAAVISPNSIVFDSNKDTDGVHFEVSEAKNSFTYLFKKLPDYNDQVAAFFLNSTN
jgi:hypothetical protein